MEQAIELRNQLGLNIPLIGNGDIFTRADSTQFIEQTGADGAMIGRGIFQNPWWYSAENYIPNVPERLALLEKHVRIYQNIWNNGKPFAILRRFFKIYVRDFDGALPLRAELMEIHSFEEVYGILGKHQ